MKSPSMLRRAVLAMALLTPCAASAAEWSWSGYFGANYEAFRNSKTSSFDAYILSLGTLVRIDPKIQVRAVMDYEHGPFYDVSSSNGTKSLDARSGGEIALSTVYGEYEAHELLKLRAGKFLAPIGIYNQLLYAVPTYPTLKIPSVAVYGRSSTPAQDATFFQRYAQGLWASGRSSWGDARLSYDLFVSNGRAARAHSDENNHKSVGGRIKGTLPLPVKVSPLVSFYTDRYDARTAGTTTEIYKSQVSVLPGLEIEAGNFVFKSECAYSEIANRGGSKDKVMASAYGEVAYTIKDRVTPYARYEFSEPDRKTHNDRQREGTLGVAYHLKLWEALVKAEVRRREFENPGTPDFNAYGMGVALAF
ncbi:MAG: hypothetical protein Q7J64_06410 [Elusimicrobiota bacterium]|nr:hypothetical protein [Elusimicrobiota bacterium]